MPYLIDGHNLIPKIPGLSLNAIDDEMQLVELLQEFCRRSQKSVEVFFDQAAPGQPRARVLGRVTARFVRQGVTADQAIQSRLSRLGRTARNWTVVSSDLAVQASARAARARFISSEAFADELAAVLQETDSNQGDRSETTLSPDELDQWLDIFGAQDGEK